MANDVGGPQPEVGLDTYTPQIANPDLTEFGFEATYSSGSPAGESKNVEYRVGAPGGPYTTVATVPLTQAPETGGWVADSQDFSKLILEVADHRLVESKTTTTSGNDLYEYSAGALRQVNVGVGTCGANIVHGNEEDGGGAGGTERGATARPHAVSSNGSRVFFEAAPGNDCSAAKHVYIRVNGGATDAETIDLGVYRFAAANVSGTEVLLEKQGGENAGLYLWSGETGQVKPLTSTGPIVSAPETTFAVAEDKAIGKLTMIYFTTTAGQFTGEAPAISAQIADTVNVYDYYIAAGSLRFAFQSSDDYDAVGTTAYVVGGGRYYYFISRVVDGLAGGAVVSGGGVDGQSSYGEAATEQIYRYDSQTGFVECVSCASGYDPEPKLGSNFSGEYDAIIDGGTPQNTVASGDGKFVFFQTPAALLPGDVDGEVAPEGFGYFGDEHAGSETSVSGDIYEWRADGVDGCAHLQGCLALLTNGQGGYLNLLLGSAEEGDDVFIYTSSQLVPQDSDRAGDIYDVRVDGGTPPPPPRPVECENAACSTPLAAPIDATPASLTFSGVGNILQPAAPKPLVKSAKSKPKKKKKKKKVKQKTRKAKRSGNGEGRR